MPLYFFDTPDGPLEKDVRGSEFRGPAQARDFAMRVAVTVAVTNPEVLADDGTLRVIATDDGGNVVARVRLTARSQPSLDDDPGR